MDIELSVRVNGRFHTYTAARKIDELQRECFAPLKTCDDRLIGALAGDVSEEQARIVVKTRKDAAEILAKELSEMIITAMKNEDTHNGYKQNE